MTAPPHAKEHHELLQLLAKATEKSDLVGHVILITLGFDGRPCVGSSIPNPGAVLEILTQLGAASDALETVTEIDMPGESN